MRSLRDHAARRCIWFVLAIALLACALGARAAETLPPKPAAYFNDYAGVVDAATTSALDEQLRQFERDTSNQIVVAVFRKMESASSVADYTVRVAQSWKVGQDKKDNGAVLFVFVDDRKMFIQVGYGLEGALPDAISKRIVDEELKPRFRTGDYSGGLKAGVEAMIAATRGEYQGTGRTAGDAGTPQEDTNITFVIFLLFGGFILFQIIRSLRRGTQYSKKGRRSSTWWGPMGGFGGGGGGWSSGGGGGGFSGGGGSFGGGGAGGDW